MTAIIKFYDKFAAKTVQGFRGVGANANGGPNAVETETERALHAAIAENARLQAQIDQIKEETTRAIEAAKQDGIEATQAAYIQDEEQALALLGEGIEAAQQRLDEQIEAIEGLSLLIGETALEALIGRPSQYHDLMSGVIKKQIKGLRKDTILTISVSPQDFKTKTKLMALEQSLSLPRVSLETDANLPAGMSQFKLTIGALEISLPQYWNELKTFFSEMIRTGEAT